MKAIIESSAANPVNANAQKVGALYASFMDEARVNQLAATPLAADLAAVKAVTDHAGMARLMGQSHEGFGASLFGIDVFEDLAEAGHELGLSGSGRAGPAGPRLLSEA